MTPITASSIAAQAFRLMELAPISAFADDSEQATDAAQQYPLVLRAALEAADWSFASRLVALSEVAADPTLAADPNLPHVYALPGDCVMLRELPDAGRWRLDARFLRADRGAPLLVRYTALVEDETAMPAQFQAALAYQLALALGPRWMTTASKLDRLARDGGAIMERAQRSDARTASAAQHTAGDWAAEAVR